MSNSINIVIVGLGPRGVTILERLAAILPQSNITQPIKIHIVDKGVPGEGVHFSHQPDYLLLNTVCSQITLFCDETVKDAGAASQGPSLYEWARAKGYRITENYAISQQEGRPIEPNDYLPRALFGKYLQEVAQQFIRECQRYAKVQVHQATAEDVEPMGNDKYMIALSNNEVIKANHLFITTGHTTNMPNAKDKEFSDLAVKHNNINERLKYIDNPYPVETIPKTVDNQTTVAIEGLGLTAFDALAALTIGKGGKFVASNKKGHLVYVKSGKEPKIVAYSLDNLPLQGRAINQKGTTQQYQARFFTRECIDCLRASRGKGDHKQLSFVDDLLPVLKKEIAFCFYTTLLRNQYGMEAVNNFAKQFIEVCENELALQQLLDLTVPKAKQLNWETFFNPMANLTFNSPSEYKVWMINYLENDLDECYLGNVDGPYKAACDVLRDIRDTIRYAVDFSGLTAESHKLFLQKYNSFMNRISVGPPKERIAQMLALIEAGVLDIFVGPQPEVSFDEDLAQFMVKGGRIRNNLPRYVDVLIKARIHPPLPEVDQSLLMRNCLKKGLFAPFYNDGYHPGGVAIDRDFHPITRHGDSLKSVWAIGSLTEGPKFYTYIVPRAGVNSTGLRDAGKAVLDMVRNIKVDKAEISLRNSLKPLMQFSGTPQLVVSPSV
jgi:uncharacterized NAD(P)/FAD-binding protein YdhS